MLKGYVNLLRYHLGKNIVKPMVFPLGKLGIGYDEILNPIALPYYMEDLKKPIKARFTDFKTNDDLNRISIGKAMKMDDFPNENWQGRGLE